MTYHAYAYGTGAVNVQAAYGGRPVATRLAAAYGGVPVESSSVLDSCADVNKAGEPCGGHPANGTEFCVGHLRKRGLLESQQPKKDEPSRAPAPQADDPIWDEQ